MMEWMEWRVVGPDLKVVSFQVHEVCVALDILCLPQPLMTSAQTPLPPPHSASDTLRCLVASLQQNVAKLPCSSTGTAFAKNGEIRSCLRFMVFFSPSLSPSLSFFLSFFLYCWTASNANLRISYGFQNIWFAMLITWVAVCVARSDRVPILTFWLTIELGVWKCGKKVITTKIKQNYYAVLVSMHSDDSSVSDHEHSFFSRF